MREIIKSIAEILWVLVTTVLALVVAWGPGVAFGVTISTYFHGQDWYFPAFLTIILQMMRADVITRMDENERKE